MANRVCVITGATSGIGRATAIGLASAGIHVVMLSRNERAAASVTTSLERRGLSVEFCRTDLASFSDVRQTASAIRRNYPTVDILVNNAGARFSAYETNSEGIERTFATNHLGHFLLTALLLDRLVASAEGRVITVGSSAHASSLEHGWVLRRETFDRKKAYAISKLANIMFAYELAHRMRGTLVTSNALDPGGVATRLGRNNGIVPWLRHLAYYALQRELRSSRQAGLDVVQLATAERFQRVTGAYVSRGKVVSSNAASHEGGLTSQLWALSVRLTRLDANLGDGWKFVDPAASPC